MMRSLLQTLAYVGQHPLGRQQRLRTIAIALAWQIKLRRNPELQVAPWVGNSKLLVKRGLHGVTGNLYYGLHEFPEMSFVALALRPGDLFADVGANAGTYTILAAKVAGADVVAFEPNEEIGRIFKQTVTLNEVDDRVTLRTDAVGDHVGEARFTADFGTMNRITEDGTMTVNLTTLDVAFADRVPLIVKLDIEGGEDACLAGAGETISSTQLQAILIETVSATAARQFREAGLQEMHYDPFTRSLNEGASPYRVNNKLFVRDRDMLQERLHDAAPLKVAGRTF